VLLAVALFIDVIIVAAGSIRLAGNEESLLAVGLLE